MDSKREEILRKIEGHMKFKGISRVELAEKWKKTDIYVYRRLSGKVELNLTDILDLCSILNLTKEEAANIFF